MVEIGKSASQEAALPGDLLTYTLALTVTGSAASNVQVVDVLPAHLDFVRVLGLPIGGAASWNPGSRTLGLSFTSLAPGVHRLTYEARVDNTVLDGVDLTNCADLTYSGWAGAPKRSCVSVDLTGVYTVRVGVYNESGELVHEILVTRRSERIEDFDITQDLVISGLNDPAVVMVDGVPLVTWNGDNRNGDPVSNGIYHLKIDNVDAYGVVHTVSQEITVSRAIAQVSVKVYNSAGEVVRELFTRMDDPCAPPPAPCPNPLAGVQASTRVLNPVASGTPGPNQVLTITSQGGLNLQWDGRNDAGRVVQNGHYEVEVNYIDGRGGSETVSLGVVVQEAGKGPLEDAVTASSNLLTGGQTTTTIQVARPEPYDMRVSLYNVAGELISSKTVNSSGTNQATLNFSGLSSGLYFAIIDLYETGTGRFILRKTLKVSFRK